MKVQELIDELKIIDPNADVFLNVKVLKNNNSKCVCTISLDETFEVTCNNEVILESHEVIE